MTAIQTIHSPGGSRRRPSIRYATAKPTLAGVALKLALALLLAGVLMSGAAFAANAAAFGS